MIFFAAVFIASSLLLAFSGRLIIDSLLGVARHLKWREFIVGFAIMSLATSVPNLFVGVSAALRGVPELSFGDVIGGNVVDLTLVMGLATLLAKGFSTESRLVQTSSLFTLGIAVLPLLLSFKGSLNRLDGIVLILAFLFYSVWLFADQARFRKSYDGVAENKSFWRHLFWLLVSLVLLISGSQGMVISAQYFSQTLGWEIGLIGLLLVALGDCLPEGYFSLVSARKREGWLVLGDLMGSVITCATLVLGVVVLIHPIQFTDFSPYFLARIFTLVAAALFVFFSQSGRAISKREGIFLLGTYLVFLLSEIFLR